MHQTALVLSGGGSRGAYEVGVWRGLRELDESFSILTGTSVGALNGAVIAQGSDLLAEQLWCQIETEQVIDVSLEQSATASANTMKMIGVLGKAALAQGGLGTEKLKKLLGEYIQEDQVRKSSLNFGIVTVRLEGLKPCYLWKEEIPQGQLIDYLLASSALFPAFRPHDIDGVAYIDGGYADNLPIRMAIDKGANKIIAVDMNAIGVVHNDPIFANYDIRTIRSYWDLGSILLFDSVSARQNIRLGYLDTLRSYGVLDGRAFAFVHGAVVALVRKTYHYFYDWLELFGFEQVKRNLIHTAAYTQLQSRTQKRGVKPNSIYGFALDGIESAAELLKLDPCVIYTPDRFRERIQSAYDQIVLPEHIQSFLGWQDKNFLAITAALELSAPQIRMKYLSILMGECIRQGRRCPLVPLAALMPAEFSAALFLANFLVAISNHP